MLSKEMVVTLQRSSDETEIGPVVKITIYSLAPHINILHILRITHQGGLLVSKKKTGIRRGLRETMTSISAFTTSLAASLGLE